MPRTPHNFIDMTGHRVGRLTVIQRGTKPEAVKRGAFWICRCDCGEFTKVATGNLRRSRPTKSCGCWRSDNMAMRNVARAAVDRLLKAA